MSEFSDKIMSWYAQNARVLPWRGHSDPYAVWVSEIMLQQTRVETVIPYFENWMEKYPTPAVLAKASQQEVLSAWEGLGYYSRARNLHKAAQLVVSQFGGELPKEMGELRKLPGVGRYTAAAIASMAFNMDEATLDGNLRRVLARVFDVAIPANSSAGEELLWKLAEEHLPRGKAGDYNQALMDLGSSICLPKKPLCLICPLSELCQSRGDPESRPVMKPRPAVPHRHKMAAVILRGRKVLMALRPTNGLLGGMWEFPAVEVREVSADSLVRGLADEYGLQVRAMELLAEIRHAYTHFTLTEHAWRCEMEVDESVNGLKWVGLDKLDGHPMGKVDRGIARAAAEVQDAG